MMFTKEQGLELISTDDTTSEWITLNGVNGRKFTSKTDTSKYIFLPAAGYWYRTEYLGTSEYGFYYSTTFATYNISHGVFIYFRSDTLHMSDGFSGWGQPIRPVRQL